LAFVEKFYGRHRKNNVDASAVNVRKARPARATVNGVARMSAFSVALKVRCAIGDLVAGVVELVDALDSKSSSERSVGSIPTARTIQYMRL
jgi:hypothetical protein